MTSTTPYPLLAYTEVYIHHHYIDDTNKTAYLAWEGIFIALSFLLNVVVIAVIAYLYVTRPTLADRSPHFIPMLACCAARILRGVWDCVLFNILRARRYEEPFGLTCRENLALELSAFMVTVLPRLLVAAVIFTHAVRMQRVLTLTLRVQRAVGAVLVVMCLLYVGVVTVPVFFMTFLEGHQNVCEEDARGKEYLNFQSDISTRRVMPAFDYIVPSLLTVLACIVLLLARFALNSNTSGSATTTTDSNPLSAGARVRPAFPLNAVLAGLSCTVLYLPFFLFMFVRWDTGLGLSRLWLAAHTLEKINGVILAVLWLLDADIRALWCRCRNASHAPSDGVSLESAGDRGSENGGNDMNRTRL